MPFRCNCKPLRIAPPSLSRRLRRHQPNAHQHTPARMGGGAAGVRISLWLPQTARWEEKVRRRRGEGEQTATSKLISRTIKLEPAFNTSLTNCLLNKRLGLQRSRGRAAVALARVRPCKEASALPSHLRPCLRNGASD